MNYKTNLFLSVLLLSQGLIYPMKKNSNIILPKSNNLRMGNFDKLPRDMQKEIFNYIFNQQYVDSLSLKQLRKVFNLKSLNKKFKDFITKEYKEEIKTKKNKLGLELIKHIQNYKPMNNLWSLVGSKDKPLQTIIDLIKLGANLNIHDNQLNTALMVAYIKGDKNIYQLLLNAGADINARDDNGNTFFMKMCDKKNYTLNKEHIEFFIKNKAKINLQNKNGETALMETCRILGLKNFKLLINSMNKADINLINNEGESILLKICKYDETDESKLHFIEVTKILINAGIDLDLKNNDGNSAMIYTSMLEKNDITKLLIDNKANLNLQNNLGQTALINACIMNKIESIKLLIKAKADLNLKDNKGNTALIHASASGQKNIVELLIHAGANINLKNNNGSTALAHASILDEENVIKLLIKAKADLNLKNNGGHTALALAYFEEKTEIVKILIESGADIDSNYLYLLRESRIKKINQFVKEIENENQESKEEEKKN